MIEKFFLALFRGTGNKILAEVLMFPPRQTGVTQRILFYHLSESRVLISCNIFNNIFDSFCMNLLVASGIFPKLFGLLLFICGIFRGYFRLYTRRRCLCAIYFSGIKLKFTAWLCSGRYCTRSYNDDE